MALEFAEDRCGAHEAAQSTLRRSGETHVVSMSACIGSFACTQRPAALKQCTRGSATTALASRRVQLGVPCGSLACFENLLVYLTNTEYPLQPLQHVQSDSTCVWTLPIKCPGAVCKIFYPSTACHVALTAKDVYIDMIIVNCAGAEDCRHHRYRKVAQYCKA